MIIIDGIDPDVGTLVVPRPNPEFDRTQPISEENHPQRMIELDAIVLTCGIHGGGGEITIMFPRKHCRELRQELRKLEGADIVEAKATDMPGGPNGAASK